MSIRTFKAVFIFKESFKILSASTTSSFTSSKFRFFNQHLLKGVETNLCIGSKVHFIFSLLFISIATLYYTEPGLLPSKGDKNSKYNFRVRFMILAVIKICLFPTPFPQFNQRLVVSQTFFYIRKIHLTLDNKINVREI